MVKYCSAYDCYSYCGISGLSFHRIPKDVVRRKQWISALKLKRQLKWDCVWICSDHFTPDSYKNTKHELGLNLNMHLAQSFSCTIAASESDESTHCMLCTSLRGCYGTCCYGPAGRGLIHKLLFRPKLAWENGNAIRK